MKLKSLLIVTVGISIASACGVSASKIMPPALAKLDNRYLDGVVQQGINKVGNFSSEKVGEIKDYFITNANQVLGREKTPLESAQDGLSEAFDSIRSNF